MINTADSSETETFIAMLMHDLKTPINAEILALEILLEREKSLMSEFQYEILQDILNTTKFMKNMTENALLKYKLGSDSFELIKNCYSLEKIIRQCIKDIKHLYMIKNQKIIFNCDTENSNANLDGLEIRRVIQNLLTNAIEYTPKNKEIFINLFKEKTNICCSVKDSGCGINLENPDDIFNKYLSLAKKQKKLGTGLGLYIAKEIIDAHNGKISVDTKINEGTTITFSIPY